MKVYFSLNEVQNMLSFEDKISIKNLWECKRFSVSMRKADILNTTCKKQLT